MDLFRWDLDSDMAFTNFHITQSEPDGKDKKVLENLLFSDDEPMFTDLDHRTACDVLEILGLNDEGE
jgi:hypothetical protein